MVVTSYIFVFCYLFIFLKVAELLTSFVYCIVGEWMNSSAGLAFSPHVVTIGVGEVFSLAIQIFIFILLSFCISNVQNVVKGTLCLRADGFVLNACSYIERMDLS